MKTVLIKSNIKHQFAKPMCFLSLVSLSFCFIGIFCFFTGRLFYFHFVTHTIAVLSGVAAVILYFIGRTNKKEFRRALYSSIISLWILLSGVQNFYSDALQRAIGRGDIDQVKIWINKGYDVNAGTGGGSNMLTRTFWYPYPNKKLFSDERILKISRQKREPIIIEMMEILIANGADINRCDDWGDTPIHRAINYPSYNIVKFLIAKGADVNLQDKTFSVQMTPLQWAIHCDELEIAELLREHGAD